MKALLASLAFALAAQGQSFDRNIVTLIPSVTPSTGVPLAPGLTIYRDLSLPPNTVSVSAPNTVTLSYPLLWPATLSVGCLNVSNATTGQMTIATCGGALPVPDSTIITQNASDPTKQMRFNDAGITSGNTRVLSVQDFNYTLAGIDHTETFTADQTFAANILASGTQNIGSPTNFFTDAYLLSVTTDGVIWIYTGGGGHISSTSVAASGTYVGQLAFVNNIAQVVFAVNPAGGFTSIGPGVFQGSVENASADTYDLGTSGSEWNNLYVHNIVCTGSCGGGLPVLDTTIITEGASDATKKMRFDNSVISTGNTRVLQVQDANYILAGINLAQTWSAVQTFNSGTLEGTSTTDVGSSPGYFRNANFSGVAVAGTVRIIDGTPFSITSFFDITSGATNILRVKDSSANILLQVDNSGSPTQWEFAGTIEPSSSGTYNLGSSSAYWNAGYINNVNVGSAIAGTYNLSGNETVTGNWYNRTFSGAPSCSGISNGWQGFDTSGLNLDLCSGSTLYSAPFGPWTPYTATVTGLSSFTQASAYSCQGKTCQVRIEVAGTGGSGFPTFTLPFTAKTNFTVLAGAVLQTSYQQAVCAAEASASVVTALFAVFAANPNTYFCEGVYEIL